MGSGRRRLLNQSTHASLAYSTALKLRHGPRRWMTPALNRPLIVSASALSQLSPTLPAEGSMPASANRSVYLIDRCWAASVAVVNQPHAPDRAAVMDGLFEGIQDKPGMR